MTRQRPLTAAEQRGLAASLLFVAAGIAVVYTGRQRAERERAEVAAGSSEDRDLGLALPHWLNPFSQSKSTNPYDVSKEAWIMYRLAKEGKPLYDYRAAEGRNVMQGVATSDSLALMKTAWRMAAISRMLGGNKPLLDAAWWNLKRGDIYAAVPAQHLKRGDIEAIYYRAEQLAKKQAGPLKLQRMGHLRALMGGFRHEGRRGAVRAAQTREREQSLPGALVTAAKEGRERAFVPLEVISGIFTGERPLSFDPGRWFRWKWGLRLGLVGVGVGAVVLMFPAQSAAAARVAAPIARRGAAAAGRAASRAGRGAREAAGRYAVATERRAREQWGPAAARYAGDARRRAGQEWERRHAIEAA